MNSGIESSVYRESGMEKRRLMAYFLRSEQLLAEVMILGLHLIPSINFYTAILVRE